MITGLFLTNPTFGQTIWDGPSMVFSKSAFANPTQEENQDRITDNVWITRGNTQGLFNAKTESGYNPNAPADTEWAQGTTAEIGSLNFQSWVDAINSNPPGSIGTDYVLDKQTNLYALVTQLDLESDDDTSIAVGMKYKF